MLPHPVGHTLSNGPYFTFWQRFPEYIQLPCLDLDVFAPNTDLPFPVLSDGFIGIEAQCIEHDTVTPQCNALRASQSAY